ncbi:WD40 repeat domain-containing protein [Rhizohabitans arisaemae]|uniref:WD40 repeat domain-containing protein n=1 Tax=Rhizohabitans arisaemae TaxID=2720610 RepID=UPI0024B15AF5|nr:WD40 repeat domain-containing protein [Rhizohabitans arisaemae]
MDPGEGAVQRFAWELRRLRESAGNPGYRNLAGRVHYSASTLAQAARGEKLPSLVVTLAYVQACGGDSTEWEARWRQAAEAVEDARLLSPGAGDDADGRGPYLGLAAFQAEDAESFHGRERMVDELVARLARQRFLAVFGTSGVGKSSLLRAGLIPRARACDPEGGGGWRTVLMTPGAHPLREYAAQVAAASGRSPDETHDALLTDPSGLPDLTEQPSPYRSQPAPLLIVVDQFEEVFTLCHDAHERGRFIAALLAGAQTTGGRTHVVLGVRADFYAHCADHLDLAAALTDAQILLAPMTTEELRQAVTQPARSAGCSVEGALLAAIVADAVGQPGALPLVSHALVETWRRRRGHTLTLAGYQEAGGIQGALVKTAETLYADLSPARQSRAKDMFIRLTALGEGTDDTARRIAQDELEVEEPDTRALLGMFAGARLITLGDNTVEVAHEALIRGWPRLHRWLTADREALRVRRRLTEAAQAWAALGHDPGALYRGARLAVVREWADEGRRDALNRLERDFLDASIRREKAGRARVVRRSRQLRYLALGLTLLLLVTAGTALVAVQQWREAEGAHRIALSRQLAAQTLTVADSEPGTAMLLAAHAFAVAPTVEARGALLSVSTLQAHQGTLTGHIGAVSQVLFSPDGRTLFSVGRDRAVAVWDVRRRTRLAVLHGHDTWLKAAALSPDGGLLATGGEDGHLVLWDTAGQARVATLAGHTQQIREITFSPDGRTLATAGDDRAVILWDALRHTRLATLNGHTGKVRGVAFSPDGRTLATAGDDKRVVLWDLTRRVRTAVLTGHAHTAGAVAFSPDGRTLASAGGNTTVILWDVGRRARLTTFSHRRPGEVITLKFSPDGRTLATSGHDPAILLWDVERRALRGRLSGHKINVYTLDFDPRTSMLASAGEDGAVLLWNTAQASPAGHATRVNDVAFSPDGGLLAAADAHRTSVWETRSRTLHAIRTDPAKDVYALAFSPDGRTLAMAMGESGSSPETSAGTVTLWDLGTGTSSELIGHTGAVLDVAFSPDGRTLATGSVDSTVILWDVARRTRLADLTGHSRPVNGVAFSPDGHTLATGGHDHIVMLWDVATRRPLAAPLAAHTAWVRTVAFSPDGRTLATADADKTVILWDVARRTRLAVVTGHADALTTGVAFHPGGRTLAFTSGDHTVTLWDVRQGRHTARLVGHTEPVQAIAFSPGGHTLATAGADGGVLLWNTDPHETASRICGALGRDLTPEEWRRYTERTPYRTTCGARW